MSEREFVRLYYKMWKGGDFVTVRYRGSPEFHKQAEVYTPFASERVIGCDTESTRKNGKLVTDLVPIAFHDGETVHSDRHDSGDPLSDALGEISERYGLDDPSPIQTTRRKKGRRVTPPAVLTVWFNLPYDVSRLFHKRSDLYRLYSGSTGFDTDVGDTHTIEWERYIDKSAPQFRWFVRDHERELIWRAHGFDLTGYWKCSLEKALSAVGLEGKDDIEAVVHNVHDRPYESFSPAEIRAREQYAATDSRQTRLLWEETLKLLVKIDPRVIRKNGLPPASAPGAAARMMFARAFDLHPSIDRWRRPPDWADRLGALAYYGGRAFCARPGRHVHCVTLDLKSAYPHAMSRLPDPVTCRYIEITEGPFNFEKWRGKWGVMVVSGEALDRVYPAFRIHEDDHLRYVAGRFHKIPVTIPELVIGVARGALRIDKVHDGVWLKGEPEKSFIRDFILDMYRIKEENKKTPLGELAKLLMNSSYGKVIQVTAEELSWDSPLTVPNFQKNSGKIAASMLHILATDGNPDVGKLFFPGLAKDRGGHEMAFEKLIGGPAEKLVLTYAGYVDQNNPRRTVREVGLQKFLRTAQTYNAGPYFMPVFASQITGFVSAQLGTMASCVQALAGDTDSVHFVCPTGEPIDHPDVQKYFEIMEKAGYPSPRKGGYSVDGQGCTLGMWEPESPCPSTESYLVRPKRYTHYFANTKKGPVFKQATHGMSRFTTEDAERVIRDGTLEKSDRLEKAKQYRQAAIHDAMRELLVPGAIITYTKRGAPRKGRTAKRTGEVAGEFVAGEVTVNNPPVRGSRLCTDGWVRWELVGRRIY